MNLDTVKHITIDGKSLVRLSHEGAVIWKGLPKGYAPLDYIETTGTQYIDTGVIPNQDTTITCEFMYFSGNGIYGARSSTAANNFCLRVINSKWQPGYGTVLGSTGIASDNEWHTSRQIAGVNGNISVDGMVMPRYVSWFAIDGVLGCEFDRSTTFEAPKTFILGGINASGKVYYGSCRYRACSIVKDFELVRDLIPCKNPDGEIGMYDTVNAVFHGNAGTGTFVAGEL